MGIALLERLLNTGDFVETTVKAFRNSAGYPTLGMGPSTPTDQGWAKGALFIVSAATSGLYQNTGDETTASWTAIADEAAAEDFGSAGMKTDVVAESTTDGGLTFKFNSIASLKGDNAAISSFTAAAATAGAAWYSETQDGGTAATDANGKAGGLFNLKTGDGSIPNGSGTTGGAGGALGFSTGAGAAGAATGTGGAGGDLTIGTGAGGATSGAGTGGRGGDLILTAGAGGTTSGGTAGRSGVVNVADGKAIVVGAVGVPATYGGGNFIGLEDSGTDPASTYTNSLAMYTPDGGDSLDFLHADGTTDSLGS